MIVNDIIYLTNCHPDELNVRMHQGTWGTVVWGVPGVGISDPIEVGQAWLH